MVVVAVVWVRISNLLCFSPCSFFPKSTQNCINSSHQLRFGSIIVTLVPFALEHPPPCPGTCLKNGISFYLQAVVEGMALKDILIQHSSKDPERQIRAVEGNKGKGVSWMRALEARKLIRCNLSECCSGLFQSCSFFLLICSVALLFFFLNFLSLEFAFYRQRLTR